MKARDVMTREVITVSPAMPVKQIAALMSEKHISGVPVVAEDGHLLGIVSQSDLLHRSELGTERKSKSWLRALADPDSIAREYAKVHGLAAHDVMNRHVVSVSEDAELQQVADTLDNHKIKRVPVLARGKLVGIITRGDLVRALTMLQVEPAEGKLDDGALQKVLLDKMRKLSWLDSSYVSLMVKDGEVELWGLSRSEDQRKALKVMIEETEGVSKVNDHLKVGLVKISGL